MSPFCIGAVITRKISDRLEATTIDDVSASALLKRHDRDVFTSAFSKRHDRDVFLHEICHVIKSHNKSNTLSETTLDRHGHGLLFY